MTFEHHSWNRTQAEIDEVVVDRLVYDPSLVGRTTLAERRAADTRLADMGYSVRQSARHLGLAARTIDRYRAKGKASAGN